MALREPINKVVVRNGRSEPTDSLDAVNRPAKDFETEGDSATRLIEASCALHRAAVVLEGMRPGTLVEPRTRYGSNAHGKVPTRGDAAIGSVWALDDIRTAMAHIDRVNATIAAASTEVSAESALSAADLTNVVAPNADRYAASTREGSLSDALQRIGSDLNSTVVRGIFEAALVLQGALQFDCEPDAVQRIESAIEVLDETIRETRLMVFALQTAEAQPRRRN